MVGGFLGAGKTTAIASLALHLKNRGLRVGLITNDQGSELVDTAMLRAKGFSTEEIPGGCFCCRFNSLVDAASRLTETTSPDVFIAEPVGSCTDLIATVTYPLRRIYGERFDVAPLSVLLDPIRAERIFGLTEGGKFSEKVLYIYRKQLEEADLIIIAKADLIDTKRLETLTRCLLTEFPHAQVRHISVRSEIGLNAWFEEMATGTPSRRAAMAVDYETYADGEALLGWLNATLQLSQLGDGFDSSVVLEAFAGEIQQQLIPSEIAHLKMTLSPDSGLGDIAVINLVRSDFVPELSLRLEQPVLSAQLIVNLRAEAAPETLSLALERAVAFLAKRFPSLLVRLEHLEHFRPGKPEPTHRDLRPVSASH
jgi:Ni2+-binding GTPase involved in maturation of urease and hydrogenase